MTQKNRFARKSPTKGRLFNGAGLASLVQKVHDEVKRTDLAKYRIGDTVKVHVRIIEGAKERIQVYEGLVIARGSNRAGRSYTVRKISNGVGVERVFLESTPKVAKLEIVQRGKVRRAKLFYIRALEGRKARIERDVSEAAKKALANQ